LHRHELIMMSVRSQAGHDNYPPCQATVFDAVAAMTQGVV
jgi:hypothetical protein